MTDFWENVSNGRQLQSVASILQCARGRLNRILIVGSDNVSTDMKPITGAGDFACLAERKPAAFIMIGNGIVHGIGSGLFKQSWRAANDPPLGFTGGSQNAYWGERNYR